MIPHQLPRPRPNSGRPLNGLGPPIDRTIDRVRLVAGPRLVVASVGSLVLDTFRQALASRMMLLALVLAGLGILVLPEHRRARAKTSQAAAGEIELMDAAETAFDPVPVPRSGG